MDILAKLSPDARRLPTYAKPGDAGLDLAATMSCTLGPQERAVIPCGISLAIPEGYAGLVIPRSGLAADHGITIVNSPGLIDSGYRGEVKAVLLNTDTTRSFEIRPGDRIAQLLIISIPSITLTPCSELSGSERGEEGFGSSGLASEETS